MILMFVSVVLFFLVPVSLLVGDKMASKGHPIMGVMSICLVPVILVAWMASLLALADQAWQENHERVKAWQEQVRAQVEQIDK